ncbi:MAG: cell division ATP-binding protein FtsE [Bdellovibrionales bacterium]
MIEITHAYKTFTGPVHALRNLDLRVNESEFLFVSGPSGAGKTTLFKVLSGVEKVTSGKVMVAGFDLQKLNSNRVHEFRREIGIVFQDFKLVPDLTALENITLPLKIRGDSKKSCQELGEFWLEKLGLIDKINCRPEILSGGEQQRLAIARALIHKPKVILADEPTGNLDPEKSEEIITLLENSATEGTSVLVITHDLEMVRRRKKRVIAIKNGEIVKDGRA